LHQGHGLIAWWVPFEANFADPLSWDVLAPISHTGHKIQCIQDKGVRSSPQSQATHTPVLAGF